MADKHRSLVSVFLEFVAGERPTADKFNALVSQTKLGFFNLETAVGDIHDESWPYAGDVNAPVSTRLTIPWGTRRDRQDAVTHANSHGRPLNIANIARLIGPASNLNPRIVNSSTATTGGVPSPWSTEIELEEIPEGIREYDFRYPLSTLAKAIPGVPAPNVVFLDNNTSPVFTTAKATLSDVKATGDYHVDLANSKVYTWDLTLAGIKVTYPVKAVEFGGGPNYSLASFNTIPDPNDILLGKKLAWLIQGQPDSRGLYGLQLPTIGAQQSNIKQNSASLKSSEDLNHNAQYKLPYFFEISSFVAGDIIPQGLMYLRCEDTGQNFTDATYYYSNQISFYVGNIELPTNHANLSWSLVTVGTDITTSIDDLRQKSFTHSHDRKYGEPAISIRELTDNFKYIADSGRFFPELNHKSNYFPQYLHRDGYRGEIDATDASASLFINPLTPPDHAGNDSNALRGHLVIGRRTDASHDELTKDNYLDKGGYLGDKGESFMLSFGDKPHNVANLVNGLVGSEHLNPKAPQIWRTKDGSTGHFRIESQQGGSLALFTGNEIAIDATSFLDSTSTLRRVTINADAYAVVRSRDSVEIVQWDNAAHTVNYPPTPSNPANNAGVRIRGLSGNVFIDALASAPHYNNQLDPLATRAAGTDNRGVVALRGENATVALEGMQLGTDVDKPLYYERPIVGGNSVYTFTTAYHSGTNSVHTASQSGAHTTYYPGTASGANQMVGANCWGGGDRGVVPEVKTLFSSHATLAYGMRRNLGYAKVPDGGSSMTGWTSDDQGGNSEELWLWQAVMPTPWYTGIGQNTINPAPSEDPMILGFQVMVRRNASEDFGTWARWEGLNCLYPASQWIQGGMHFGNDEDCQEASVLCHLLHYNDFSATDIAAWGNPLTHQNYHQEYNSLRVEMHAGGAGPVWDSGGPDNVQMPTNQNLGNYQPSWQNCNPFHRNFGMKLGNVGNHNSELGDQGGYVHPGPENAPLWFLPVTIRVLWFYTTR
jgi:hypothetical protein